MHENIEILLHALVHSVKHTLPLLPFLYLTYLAMELLERRAGEKTERAIARAGRAGPLLGGLLGLLPQCSFSAVGAGLYAGRVISAGTVLAIFWSTSDEMLPLLISSGTPPRIILTILGCKVLIAVVFGFIVDMLLRLIRPKNMEEEHPIGELCRAGHCHCDDRPLAVAALIHTLSVFVSIFAVSFALEVALTYLGDDFLSGILTSSPFLACLLSALVGLIPNCAASVTITQLYLNGILSPGAMLAGLLVGAGVGALVLLRVNRPWRNTLCLLSILFFGGLLFGIMFDALSLGAWLGL